MCLLQLISRDSRKDRLDFWFKNSNDDCCTAFYHDCCIVVFFLCTVCTDHVARLSGAICCLIIGYFHVYFYRREMKPLLGIGK
jgi:hypothetical protein